MSKAYILTHYPVTQEQYQYVRELLKARECNDDDFKLFCHILVSSLVQRRDGHQGWAPVPAQLIKEWLPKASWRRLEEKALIDVWEFDRSRGECNEYQISTFPLEAFLCRSPIYEHPNIDEMVTYSLIPKVNLFTGKPITKPLGHVLYDDNRNEPPQLIVQAMAALNVCYLNIDEVAKHLQALQTEYEQSKTSQEFRKREARYQTDVLCLQSVLNQHPSYPGSPYPDHIREFTPAYRLQTTGRISMLHGGLQSCSRRMKAAAYTDVPVLHNYDVKACHPNILLQLFEDAGIHSEWLNEYIADSRAKVRYAAQAGLSVDTWKSCLYAVLMGGNVPTQAHKRPLNSIEGYIQEEAGSMDKADLLIKGFKQVIAPLKAELDALFRWIESEWLEKHSYIGYGGKRYVKNQAGCTLSLDELINKSGRLNNKSRLLAFILQGTEAAFIHHLTILGSQYGYRPIGNEHDGLITIGALPTRAVEKARELSGFRYAQLEEKVFVS